MCMNNHIFGTTILFKMVFIHFCVVLAIDPPQLLENGTKQLKILVVTVVFYANIIKKGMNLKIPVHFIRQNSFKFCLVTVGFHANTTAKGMNLKFPVCYIILIIFVLQYFVKSVIIILMRLNTFTGLFKVDVYI